MRGRVSATSVPAVAPRRERMRGRLGTGTEGVCGRGHGPGMLPARRNRQHGGLVVRCPAHLGGQFWLERERRAGAGPIHRGGERPEQERAVLEEGPAGGSNDGPDELATRAPVGAT